MNFEKIMLDVDNLKAVPVVIEISMDADPIKYEFNKEIGVLMVDRFMQTAMRYPCNYGFVPNTLSGDGDPVDVLVYSNFPIQPGALVYAKPIGVLVTKDEKGQDEKILAVPVDEVDPFFMNIHSYQDLPAILLGRINHFFKHYKDLETAKWVEIEGWKDFDEAYKIIKSAVLRYNA